MSEDEDKYIRQHESDQIARIRRERQLAALRAEETEGIAKALNSSEDIAQEALELGFDKDTARILHLVPVIQIAWADDRVQIEERVQILEMAADHGLTSGALEFLELLLDEKPSDLFFERTNRVIAHLLAEHGSAAEKEDLLFRAQEVARSAGGLFGFKTVSDEEQKLLESLEKMLNQ